MQGPLVEALVADSLDKLRRQYLALCWEASLIHQFNDREQALDQRNEKSLAHQVRLLLLTS